MLRRLSQTEQCAADEGAREGDLVAIVGDWHVVSNHQVRNLAGQRLLQFRPQQRLFGPGGTPGCGRRAGESHPRVGHFAVLKAHDRRHACQREIERSFFLELHIRATRSKGARRKTKSGSSCSAHRGMLPARTS